MLTTVCVRLCVFILRRGRQEASVSRSFSLRLKIRQQSDNETICFGVLGDISHVLTD